MPSTMRTVAQALRWNRQLPLHRDPVKPDLASRVLMFFSNGSSLVKQIKNFFQNEQGAELAEYAVGVAILVAIALVVYRVLGSAVNVKMNTVANEVQK